MISEILAGIVKEFKLLRSQKIAVALVILYPIIIGLSLGVVYSGEISQAVSVGVMVEQSAMPAQVAGAKQGGFSGIDFLAEMRAVQSLDVLPYNDRNSLLQDVESGKVKTGVVVRRDEKNGPYKIEAITDNSRIIESMIIKQFVLAAVDRVTAKITLDLLREIWGSFLKNEEKLKEQRQRIALLRESFEETKPVIREIDSAVNSFDINGLRESTKTITTSLDSLEKSVSKIEIGANRLNGSTQGVFDSANNLSNLEADLYSLVALKIVSDVNQSQASLPLASWLEDKLHYYHLEGVFNSIPDEDRAGFWDKPTELKNNISSQISRLQAIYSDSLRVKGHIGETRSALSSLGSSLVSTVDNIKEPIPQLKADISSAKYWAERISAAPDRAEEGLAKIKKFADDWNGFESSVEKDLNDTGLLIDDLLASMQEIKTYPPEMLASPTQVWFRDIFPQASVFSLLLPASLSIVMLFTAVLLTLLSVVSERRQRVYLRLQTSPASRVAQVMAKVCAQTLIAMLECALIAVLAVLAFNAVIGGQLLDMIVVLAVPAIFFVSIGLFLSVFFKNESSAILGCLLLVVPALLVSGIIIPFELMPSGFQFVEAVNPLSAAITMISGVIVRGHSSLEFLPAVLAMLSISALLILVKLAKKEQ